MSITIVCGVNWGDEGKGRMVDLLAENADLVIRFQGGNNAGHTVINDSGTFKLHLIPSGVFRPQITNVLGPGMVIDIEALVKELTTIRARGIVADNIVISNRATVCLPYHRDEDRWEEERLGKRAFGSTQRGIAPSYGDRYLKKAIRIGDIFDEQHLRSHLSSVIDWKQLSFRALYGDHRNISLEETLDWLRAYGKHISSMVGDTSTLLESAYKGGKRLLFEGQLGALKDIHFGIYPYTSSSCSLASFAPIGSGLFGKPVDRIVGVVKAFSTCVGQGPFTTEIVDGFADEFRMRANEFGASTGRPRRIGWFDAVASRFGVYLQGTTELALTKLDCLSGIRSIPICTSYSINGMSTTEFPMTPQLERATPEYEDLAGWEEDISGCRSSSSLPIAAQQYVARIEELLDVHIRYVSVGPHREQIIERV